MSQEYMSRLVNVDNCQEIVNKFNQETNNHLQLKSFIIMPATEAKGFLAEYFHLIIQCVKQFVTDELNDSDCHNDVILLNFFIKSLSPLDEQHEKVRIFRKESSLYASLLPKLQNYSPAAWYPKVYLSHKSLLVLEDLRYQGFYCLAWKENLKRSEMFPVLSGLAAMHASSLLYEFETKTSIAEFFGGSLTEITVHPDIPWYTTGINAILKVAKNLPKYQGKIAQQFIVSELPLRLKNLYSMINTSTKYRNVLCHRDTWGGNIFLNCGNQLKPAVFVDFQTCRYCPPAIDVILTLFMNLTKHDRLEKQSSYLKFYYQQLLQYVEDYMSSDKCLNEVIFSEAEFLDSIQEFMLFGFVYRALAITVLKVPKEFVTDYYKNEERSERLLGYMKENEDFCQTMTESVEDIVEAVADISHP